MMLAETVIYRDHNNIDRAAIVTAEYDNGSADLTVFLQQGQLFLGGVDRHAATEGVAEILPSTWRPR